MDGFKGTPEQFQKAFQDLGDRKIDIDSNLATLRSNIEATRMGWTGLASGKFATMMEHFDAKARKCSEALEHIGELLEQSGNQYQASEDDKQERVSALAGLLDD